MDIGFQLYSARNYPLADVLKKVAALGYTQVEGYGALYANPDPAALKALLDQNGLTMPTAHISLGDLEDTSKTLKLAETLGIKVVVCPWLAPHERPLSASGWQKFGEKLQKIGKPFQDAGLGFGYHNHDFEFVSYDGRFGMDYLLEAAPAVACEVRIASDGQTASVAVKSSNDRLDGWEPMGKFTLDLTQTIEGQVEPLKAPLVADNFAEGLLNRLVRVQVTKKPRTDTTKAVFLVQVDNASPLILNGIALTGAVAEKGQKVGAIAGLNVGPRRSLTLPTLFNSYKALGLTDGVRVLAADLSGL